MNAAIHFPEPVAIDDPIAVSTLPTRQSSWRAPGKAVAVGLGVLVTGAVILTASTAWSGPVPLPVEAAGTAEIAVRQHLSESGNHYIAASAVVLSGRQDDEWTVGVTVDLLARSDGGYVPAGTQHFEVTLAGVGSGWQVVGGPAHLAAPDLLAPAPAELTPAAVSPLTDAVQQYLDWLLVGLPGGFDGDRPTPTPYQQVTIEGMGITPLSGDRTAVQVTATGTDQFGYPIELRYGLEVLSQQGTWMVVADR